MRMKAGGMPRYRNVFDAGQVIFREFGIRGLFQGVGATCLRNIPACSIYFGMVISFPWPFSMNIEAVL